MPLPKPKPNQQELPPGTLRCETEIGDHMIGTEPLSYRLANGLPLLCGRPAGWYRMSGQLASVPAKLCKRHVEMFEARGLKVMPLSDAPKE